MILKPFIGILFCLYAFFVVQFAFVIPYLPKVECTVIAVDQHFHRLDSVSIDSGKTAAAVSDMLKVKNATFVLIKCDTIKTPN